jgi:hypothetical protein
MAHITWKEGKKVIYTENISDPIDYKGFIVRKVNMYNMWSITDQAGKECFGDQLFTTSERAEAYINNHLEKQKRIEERKEIERQERERQDYDNENSVQHTKPERDTNTNTD